MTGQLRTAGEPAPAAGDPAPTAAVADIRDRAASLRHITQRIADDPALPEGANAIRSLQEALKFLDVAAASAEPVAPSKAVDVAWHHFILFTPRLQGLLRGPSRAFRAPRSRRHRRRRREERSACLLAHPRTHHATVRRPGPDCVAGRRRPVRLRSKGNCSSECSGDCSGN